MRKAKTTKFVPIEEDRRIGKRVGNLKIVDRIGIGGMGAVYRSVHRVLETPYAIKVLHPRFSEDKSAVERFRHEAIAASRLRHNNVVFVTDFGFDKSVGLYIVMEFLEGFTLKRLLEHNGSLKIGRMVRIAEQVCGAMSAAHRLGVVHRDLKPENIMVLGDSARRDHVKVLDFGIARLRSVEDQDSEEVIGTPSYMAPEQIASSPNSGHPSVDIYALGMMFYAMLTGKPPFFSSNTREVLESHLHKKPPLLGLSMPELVGTKLESLVASMMEKQPSRRPENLEAVQEALKDALAELIEADIDGTVYEPMSQVVADALTDTTVIWEGAVSGTIRMTTVIRQIRSVSPDSAAAVLLDAMPSLETIRGEALCLALWGILQQELLEHEPGSTDFQVCLDQLVLLMQALLESHDGEELSKTQRKMFRALRVTLNIFDSYRRQQILSTLRPLAADPKFPVDILEGENSGSWESFKRVMTAEIRLPWRRSKAVSGRVEDTQDTFLLHDLPLASVSDETLANMSLLSKLKQDVSLRSINAVLTHEFRLFNEGEEPGEQAEPEDETEEG